MRAFRRVAIFAVLLFLCLFVAETEAGVQVFDPNTDLQMLYCTGMMTALIIFTVIFEHATHHLDHFLGDHHPAFSSMVSKIYKEVMILGFISFVLTMCLQAEMMEDDIGLTMFSDPDLLIGFEFGHYAIFFMALLTIAQGLYFMAIMIQTAKAWDKYSADKPEDLVKKLGAKPKLGNPFIDFFSCCRSRRASVEHAVLHDFFVETHLLPLNFDFSKYLWESLALFMDETIEIESYTWLAMVVFLWLNYLRLQAGATAQAALSCPCAFPKYYEIPCKCWDTNAQFNTTYSCADEDYYKEFKTSNFSSSRRLLSPRGRRLGAEDTSATTAKKTEGFVADSYGRQQCWNPAETEVLDYHNKKATTKYCKTYHEGSYKYYSKWHAFYETTCKAKSSGRRLLVPRELAADPTTTPTKYTPNCAAYKKAHKKMTATAKRRRTLLGVKVKPEYTDSLGRNALPAAYKYKYSPAVKGGVNETGYTTFTPTAGDTRCAYEGHFTDLIIFGFILLLANFIVSLIIYRARRYLLHQSGLKTDADALRKLKEMSDEDHNKRKRVRSIVESRDQIMHKLEDMGVKVHGGHGHGGGGAHGAHGDHGDGGHHNDAMSGTLIEQATHHAATGSPHASEKHIVPESQRNLTGGGKNYKVAPTPAPGGGHHSGSGSHDLKGHAEHVRNLGRKVFPCMCMSGAKAMVKVQDTIITFNCLYMALFFLFFMTQYEMALNVLAFVPFLINFFIISPINIKNLSFVNCIIEIEGHVVGKIIEYQTEAHLMKGKIRKGIQSRLDDLGATQEDLRRMFDEIDKDKSGQLDRREFRRLLTSLGIFLSSANLSELLRTMDPDMSGSIDFHEFVDFMKAGARGDKAHASEEEARKLAGMVDLTGKNIDQVLGEEGVSGGGGDSTGASKPAPEQGAGGAANLAAEAKGTTVGVSQNS